MTRIAVHQAENGKAAVANPFFVKMEKALEAVRARAYELFRRRGEASGSELEDWLNAERELFFVPDAETIQTEKAFTMKIAAPGLAAGNVEVIALPREILVEARFEKSEETAVESKCFYRRFEFGEPIDTKKVRATLNHGQLTIEAPKKVHPIPVRAAAA
jgi:HSP20 family molecular chaperone IbpA